MKQLSIILLTALVLLPVIWNGVSFLHYVVEHTHAFCESEVNHEHTSADDCLNICHINQDQNQIPSKVKFYDLKQYINSPSSLNTQSSFITSVTKKPMPSLYTGRIYSGDVFHPPLS